MNLGEIGRVLEAHKKLQHLKVPQGTRDSPARSCNDLFLEGTVKDGKRSLVCHSKLEFPDRIARVCTTGLY